MLLLLALAAAVLVSLLTPAGASATLERPAPVAEGGPSAAPRQGVEGAPDPPTSPTAAGPADPGVASAPETDAIARPVLVHVLGSVAAPGLFELGAGARVVDAVAAAGGLTPGADSARINLARVVADGEQLYVPAVGEVIPLAVASPGATASGPGGAAAVPAVVDLNAATLADLDTLPRIGPGLAQRILDWRTANGRFSAPEDLLEVPGIGERTFEGLHERVRV
ncbi:ComEA family DNA-binding protein [Microbacteriaceae bacterium 4G12]